MRNDSVIGRFYTLPDGTRLPSVTTVLKVINKPQLISWAAREERELVCGQAAKLHVSIPSTSGELTFYTQLKSRLPEQGAHETLLRVAGAIGSNVHALIEWVLRNEVGIPTGPQPSISGPEVHAFAAWESWRKSTSLKPIVIEQTVWSRTHGYAGTLDLLAEVNLPGIGRVMAVFDWKTSKNLHPENDLQVAAYGHAITEMGHAPSGIAGVLIRLPKLATDSAFEVRVLTPFEMARAFDTFTHALALYRWLEPTPAASIPATQKRSPGPEWSFA